MYERVYYCWVYDRADIFTVQSSKQIKDKQILLAENIRKSTEKSISWHMPQSQICHRLM